MDTIRLGTILCKGTDTSALRVAWSLASPYGKWSKKHLIDSGASYVTTFTSRAGPHVHSPRESEQIPYDGVDRGSEEANH